MKFCKDCKHYTPMKYSSDDGNCGAPAHGVNLVTGQKNLKVCSAQRSVVYTSSVAGYCGMEAIFFEEKE